MPRWIAVGQAEQLPQEGKTCLDAEGKSLILCRVDGELAAVENVCPHAGMPIGDGDLCGAVLTCPYHGYTYNVKNGSNVDWPDDTPLQTFPVRVRDGKVEVDFDADGQSGASA